MALEQFKSINFKPTSLSLIEQCNSIIEEYQADDLKLTLRQLYYQLVSRDVIPNVPRSYKNLSTLVTDARYAGMMDWEAIEDRVRPPHIPLEFSNLQHRVESAIYNYRLDRWEGQENYVELWVEKDALSGVLRPLADEFHVTMMVNKGYSSASAMYESAERFNEKGDGRDKVLLYLGDHDPSGEDMVRDIRDRLSEFHADVDVRKLALTMTQVRQHKPPPNPAKITDPRAVAYIAKFGDHSWEVDALPPRVLARTIRAELDTLVDRDLMDEVVAKEDKDKEYLKKAVAAYKEK